MRVSVISEDIFLYRKILLALSGIAEVMPFGDSSGEVRICDLRGGGAAAIRDIAIISRKEWSGDESTLPYPFTYDELRAAIAKATDIGGASLKIHPEERCALLYGEKIKLTVIEYKLLEAILSGGGKYVSREELIRRVWGDEVQGGVLNVYVHYLRDKLELYGEKIIISSRKSGYKIDEKYMGKGNE